MCKSLQITSRTQTIKYNVNCLKNDVSGLKNAKYEEGPGTYQMDQCTQLYNYSQDSGDDSS